MDTPMGDMTQTGRIRDIKGPERGYAPGVAPLGERRSARAAVARAAVPGQGTPSRLSPPQAPRTFPVRALRAVPGPAGAVWGNPAAPRRTCSALPAPAPGTAGPSRAAPPVAAAPRQSAPRASSARSAPRRWQLAGRSREIDGSLARAARRAPPPGPRRRPAPRPSRRPRPPPRPDPSLVAAPWAVGRDGEGRKREEGEGKRRKEGGARPCALSDVCPPSRRRRRVKEAPPPERGPRAPASSSAAPSYPPRPGRPSAQLRGPQPAAKIAGGLPRPAPAPPPPARPPRPSPGGRRRRRPRRCRTWARGRAAGRTPRCGSEPSPWVPAPPGLGRPRQAPASAGLAASRLVSRGGGPGRAWPAAGLRGAGGCQRAGRRREPGTALRVRRRWVVGNGAPRAPAGCSEAPRCGESTRGGGAGGGRRLFVIKEKASGKEWKVTRLRPRRWLAPEGGWYSFVSSGEFPRREFIWLSTPWKRL